MYDAGEVIMPSCRIPMGEMRVGDVVVFKRNGFVSWVLGGILRLFEPKWDGWGWHVGFIAGYDILNGFLVCESLAQGIVLNPLANYDPLNYRIYRWLNVEPEAREVALYLEVYLGKPYDVAIYFWTMAQYLFRHFWNRRIPRLLDDRYTCWENVFEFSEDMGKRIGSKYDCPLITDMLRAFGEM